MIKKSRRLLGLFAAFAMTFSTTMGDWRPAVTSAAVDTGSVEATAAVSTAETSTQTTNSYDLPDEVNDGVILHCWNWSYTNIKNSMAEIAESGYVAVQTSPVQMPKDASAGDNEYGWWKVYQPTTLSMADNHPWFGSKDDFKAMCDEAEKYGIKVIVDVVANHMANTSGDLGNCKADIYSGNDATFRDDESCWHLNGSTGIDYNNQHRTNDSTSLTYGFGGWPDLNTGSTKVQNAIISLLEECVDLGADGFRFDAAKHIELPTDSSGASDFWPNVTNTVRSYAKTNYNEDLYLYGEILDSCATDISNYTKYIAVTDNRAGNAIRWGVYNNNINDASNSYLNYSGENADNIVLWAESHDTYANNNFTGESTTQNQAQINRAWCIIAARDFTALYYVRPGSTSAAIGSKSTNTAWKDAEVVATNKFHNYFTDTSEYMSSDGSSVVLVERGKKTSTSTCGVVLVNIGGGSKSVSGVTTHLMADGQYTDQITGNTFTVSGGCISGQIGSTGVAVVYNATVVKTPSLTANPGSESFTSDSVTVNLTLANATSGTYKIGSEAAKTITASTSITLGADLSAGESVTLVTTATDGTETTTNTYTYTKKEQSSNVAYLSLPSGWSTPVYCYAYDSATEKVSNGSWPGVQMTYDSATGYYKYEIPDTIESPRVIFYSSDSNRYPADMQKGLLFETDGSWLYKDGSWAKTETKGTVIAKYVDESGNTIADSVTTSGTTGTAYTTTAKTIEGYTLKETPSNATGTYSSGTVTVSYVYSVITGPTVTASVESGTSFKTDSIDVTLTLSNATSGTYQIDNGITKKFTGSTTVTVGQGKISDSTVTLVTTATDGSKTTTTTYTYNKVFSDTINDVSGSAASSATLDDQYKTTVNKTVKKTITVDGSLTEWSSDMLIAQGAANDDPRVYRPNSMYENPIDLYALYATYDDDNLYLMWEMTNVQDIVAPSDDYPLSQAILWQTMNIPFMLAVDTGDSSSVIGNNCKTAADATLWDSGITFTENVNRLIMFSTKPGANGPYVYGGDSTGLNAKEIYNSTTSGIKYVGGKGILSSSVMGIDGAYGTNNGRVVGDMTTGATYIDFNAKGHSTSTLDFCYEMSIPLSTLGVTSSDVDSNGLGLLLVATSGKSGMDSLPYDLSMNDNADLDDSAGSQENNSFEKSDEDELTSAFAGVGNYTGAPIVNKELKLNFGADKSAPQLTGTELTLSAIVTGGSGNYTKCEYYVDGTLVSTQTSVGTYSWTPSTAGKHTIKCVVTDSEGKTVTSSKYYTVEASSETVAPALPTVTLKASTTSITASWDAVEGATYYRVFKYIDGGYKKVADTTKKTYVISGLASGTKYGVIVLAYNGTTKKWSKYSSSDRVYATTLCTTATVTLTPAATKLTAKWDAVTGATKYRVFKYVNSKYVKLGDTTGTSYSVTGLASGTKYGVIVLAYNGSKWSSYTTSNIAYAKTLCTTPTLTLTAGNAKITAKWSAQTGATKYRVFKYIGGKYTKIADTTSTSYTVTGLTNGTKCGIIVLAYNGSKWSSYTTSNIKYATPTA